MVIGIDPGLQGAIVSIKDDGKLFDIHDMPTVNIQKGKTSKSMYDISILCTILSQISSEKDTVFIEKTQPIYGVRVQASYGLGYCEGLLVGILTARKISYELIRPQEWQKHFKITKARGDKKIQSYQIARQLFPLAELATPRGRKLDGRSDALLIAEWGRRHLQGKI